MKIPIIGMQKMCLIDFPGITSSVIFIGGCNFRCPYCHNPDLVLKMDEAEKMDEEAVIDTLVDRKAWIDGVVITGGEPTLYPDLKRFARRIKDIGLKVKIDTNGTNPELLWDMLEEKLIDYIAMDIKGPLSLYENIVFMPVDIEKIKRSITLIRNSGVDYEFRTTAAPKITTKESLIETVKPLKGAKKFVIQQFRTGEKLPILDPLFFRDEKPYTKEELAEMKKAVEPYFEAVEVRE
jgi:pyruvate formate lyase activating enzyme